MNNLVTFFSETDEGVKLVGVGVTDDMIKELKKRGGILQESERTGQNVDLVLMYAPTLNQLVAKVKSVVNNAQDVQVKHI